MVLYALSIDIVFLKYNIMTEEEKEDYLYEYIDAFIEALYNESGEH